MLHHTTTEYDHATFAGLDRDRVQPANVLCNVHNQAWRAEGVHVDHVTERAVGQCGTEYGNIVAIRPVEDGLFVGDFFACG